MRSDSITVVSGRWPNGAHRFDNGRANYELGFFGGTGSPGKAKLPNEKNKCDADCCYPPSDTYLPITIQKDNFIILLIKREKHDFCREFAISRCNDALIEENVCGVKVCSLTGLLRY